MTATTTLDEQLSDQRATLAAKRAALDTAAGYLADARLDATDDKALARRLLPDLELAVDLAARDAREAEVALEAAKATAREEALGPYTAAQRQDYAEQAKLLDKARAIHRRMVERREQHVQRTGANVSGIAFGWLEQLDETRAWLRAEGVI